MIKKQEKGGRTWAGFFRACLPVFQGKISIMMNFRLVSVSDWHLASQIYRSYRFRYLR